MNYSYDTTPGGRDTATPYPIMLSESYQGISTPLLKYLSHPQVPCKRQRAEDFNEDTVNDREKQ